MTRPVEGAASATVVVSLLGMVTIGLGFVQGLAVREEWHHAGESRSSVADGLAATATAITAAAAIMVVVFSSFLLEDNREFTRMGAGHASAIFLDASIVRMLLVPATMELLGDRNWWIPRWLDRILPNINVEGHHRDEDLAPSTVPPGAPEDERDLEPVE